METLSWRALTALPFHYCYRAMHFSAKRGIAIACRLSVCLSVCKCNVGGLWSHSLDFSEIISPLVSLGCSLSADPNTNGLLQGEHPEILAQIDPPPVDLSVRDIRLQIAAEWLHIVQRSQWRAYRKPPSLFLMVPSLIPYAPLPPNDWNEGSICHQDTRMAISMQRVIRYTSYLGLG